MGRSTFRGTTAQREIVRIPPSPTSQRETMRVFPGPWGRIHCLRETKMGITKVLINILLAKENILVKRLTFSKGIYLTFFKNIKIRNFFLESIGNRAESPTKGRSTRRLQSAPIQYPTQRKTVRAIHDYYQENEQSKKAPLDEDENTKIDLIRRQNRA